jgi:hypothetical protein
MSTFTSRTRRTHILSALLAPLFLFLALTSQLPAQTFQTVQGLSFTSPFAGANPLPQVVTIASTGALLRFTPVASTNGGGNWLSVSPANNGCCYTPYPVTVSVSAAGLAAGTYTGQVVVTDFSNANNKITIPVTLNVAASGATFFDDLPGKLSFSFKTSGTNPPGQQIQIRYGGSGTLNWTVAATTGIGGAWLTTSASSGTAPSFLTVGINKANLPGGGATAGTYVGLLTFTAGSDTTTIPVAVTVGNPIIEQMNPMSFTMPFGGNNPLSQVLVVETSDNSALRFTPVAVTAKGGNWLSVTPANNGCCYAPYPIIVTVTPGTLPAGSYTGEITIVEYANPAQSMTVPVTLNIVSSGAFFNDLPGALSYSLKVNGGVSPQVILVDNKGSGSLNWSATTVTSDSGNWLTVSASSGTAPSVLTIGVNPGLLPGGSAVAGTIVGQILFQSGTDTSTIPVAVTVGNSVLQQVNPINLTMPFGGANPLPQVITVESADNSAVRFTPIAATGQGGNWLSVSPANNGCCYTPYPLTVSVNASTLPAGTYTGEVTVIEYANPARSLNIPVTLTVPSSGAFFDNLPGKLSFSLTKGGAGVSQLIHVNNGGIGTLNWTVLPTTSDGSPWLSTSAANGAAPSNVTVSVNPTMLPGNGLLAGTYVGHLLFQTAGDMSSIPVSVTVGDSVFQQMNPISFTMPFGGANPPTQILTVSASDGAAIRFTPIAATSKGGNWLSVSPANNGCCYAPYPVSVSVNASTLPAGVYTGEITIVEYANPSREMTVPVTLTISASGAFFDNLPGQMTFSMKKGAKATPQTLQIGNAGSGKLKFTVTPITADGGAWLKPSVLSTTAPKTITVSIVQTALPGGGQLAGTFLGQLLLVSDVGITATVNVTVNVSDSTFSQVNPLNFVMPFGGANPLPQILTVAANDGSNIRFTPVASTGNGGAWLSVSPANNGCCYAPYPLTVSVTAPSLKVGTYFGEINIIEYANPSRSVTVPVTLTVTAASKAFFDNLPGQTSFSMVTGTTANPPLQTIHVRNAGNGSPLNWSVATSTADPVKWLTVTPTKGVDAGAYTVKVTTSKLPGKGKIAGTYLGQQLVKTKAGNVTIPVVVTVADPVFTQLPELTFSTTVGVNPANQVISVASSGAVIRFTPIARSSKGGNWLSVSPSANGCCNTPTNVTVSVNASALPAGSYTGQINVIEYANPGKSMTIPVILNISAAAEADESAAASSGTATP